MNKIHLIFGFKSCIGWIIYEDLYLLLFLLYLVLFINFYEIEGVRTSLSNNRVKHIENLSRQNIMRNTQKNSNHSAESEINNIFDALHLFTFESEKKILLFSNRLGYING